MKICNQVMMVLLILGCNRNVATQTPKSFGPWQVLEQSQDAEVIALVLQNATEEPLTVLQPMEKDVRKLVDGDWTEIPVMYCDCGSKCPSPPEYLVIEPGEIFSFKWDLLVEECIDDNGKLITSKTRANPGKYLIIYAYRKVKSRDKYLLKVPFEL